MTIYTFALLDPRPTPEAKESNDKLLAAGPVYGIEVTVPALAERCVHNLDPQHTGGDHTTAAITAALTTPLPADGATLATIRPDLDAVGAMSVLALRREWEHADDNPQVFGPDQTARIQQVADADTFSRGAWKPRPLPSSRTAWSDRGAVEDTRGLAAIGAAVADNKIPLDQRVQWMTTWILTGQEPARYRDRVERERQDMIAALEDGTISLTTAAGGWVAVVESTHRAATAIGYTQAPVVIARNPKFAPAGGGVKYTICQYQPGHVDLKAALADLAALESGWGGSPTIGGSPQGTSSVLPLDTVVAVVAKHLI